MSTSGRPMTVVMVPTWNEFENIGPLIDAILSLALDIHVLVVDDNSPDGTHRIVAEREAVSPFVHLLLRTTKRGRGSAGVDGFRRALAMGAEIIVEMDADFSHPIRYLPILLRAIDGVDVVFASRLVKGGGEVNRSFKRVAITKTANLLTRTVMGYPVHDCTAGYRVFRRNVLESIDLDSLEAEGPAIVGEVLYRVIRSGFRVREVPYIYEDRKFGQSTLRSGTLLNCLWWLTKLKWRQATTDAATFRKARRFYAEHPPEPASEPWSDRSS
jgi:dolichol-phosphate mannosyltransferase